MRAVDSCSDESIVVYFVTTCRFRLESAVSIPRSCGWVSEFCSGFQDASAGRPESSGVDPTAGLSLLGQTKISSELRSDSGVECTLLLRSLRIRTKDLIL